MRKIARASETAEYLNATRHEAQGGPYASPDEVARRPEGHPTGPYASPDEMSARGQGRHRGDPANSWDAICPSCQGTLMGMNDSEDTMEEMGNPDGSVTCTNCGTQSHIDGGPGNETMLFGDAPTMGWDDSEEYYQNSGTDAQSWNKHRGNRTAAPHPDDHSGWEKYGPGEDRKLEPEEGSGQMYQDPSSGKIDTAWEDANPPEDEGLLGTREQYSYFSGGQVPPGHDVSTLHIGDDEGNDEEMDILHPYGAHPDEITQNAQPILEENYIPGMRVKGVYPFNGVNIQSWG